MATHRNPESNCSHIVDLYLEKIKLNIETELGQMKAQLRRGSKISPREYENQVVSVTTENMKLKRRVSQLEDELKEKERDADPKQETTTEQNGAAPADEDAGKPARRKPCPPKRKPKPQPRQTAVYPTEAANFEGHLQDLKVELKELILGHAMHCGIDAHQINELIEGISQRISDSLQPQVERLSSKFAESQDHVKHLVRKLDEATLAMKQHTELSNLTKCRQLEALKLDSVEIKNLIQKLKPSDQLNLGHVEGNQGKGAMCS